MAYLNPRIDVVVCVSDAVRTYLRSMGLPDHRLEVIHKGHDPAWYAEATAVSRDDLGLPGDAVVAGFVGNMRPVKGVRYLVEAMHRIPSDHPLRLLLVGDVRDQRLLRQAAHPSVRDRIRLLGFRRDAASLYPAMDLSVMPSVDREGLPRAILESMAQGVPCIGTEVGGIPELIENGVSGLLVPPRDPEALAEALLCLADDPSLRFRMGDAARARVQGPFHLHHTIDKTRDLYLRLQTGLGPTAKDPGLPQQPPKRQDTMSTPGR
jgi:glycosyltransferase involved in cell wall biosynthesis